MIFSSSERLDAAPSTQGTDMRPWIQTPQWDGKIVLAAIFTIGYFWIIYILVGPQRHDLTEAQKEIATIALAALGPQLGQIFGSIFRTTAADERSAARRDDTLKTAITTPSGDGSTADQVEEGARAGTKQGVTEGLNGKPDEAEPLT